MSPIVPPCTAVRHVTIVPSILKSGPVWFFPTIWVQLELGLVAVNQHSQKTGPRPPSTSLPQSTCCHTTSCDWSFQELVADQSKLVDFQLQLGYLRVLYSKSIITSFTISSWPTSETRSFYFFDFKLFNLTQVPR